MKKLLALLMVVTLTSAFVKASDDHPIAPEQLPNSVKLFLAEHFPNEEIALAKMEKEFWGREYKVYLVGGAKIEFGKNNEWKEVDCEFSEIPYKIIPQKIREFIMGNYPEQKIIQIEKKDKKSKMYEVELGNSVEIVFDYKFNVVDIDY